MKPFTTIAVVVLMLVALLQIVRLVLGWDLVINGHAVPAWASAIHAALAALLAIMVAREARR